MWHLTSFVFHIRKDIVLFFLFIIQKKKWGGRAMENLAPFRQGHSGIRWTLLPHQAALEWTSSTIAAVILKHKALWTVQGGDGGGGTKTKMAELHKQSD